MKFVDEFRDPQKAKQVVGKIKDLIPRIPQCRERPIYIMEVCGGHTHTIFRYGLTQMLPEEVQFIHGPGCPVCVLPRGRVDDCVALAEQPDVIVTTFGDAMRVTGSSISLMQAKANGADVRMVYSPLDALALARTNPDKEVVFFGLGFETTMPSTALTVLEAQKEGIKNFSLFCNHITIIPTIKAVLDSPNVQIDGFLGPGHVTMIIGLKPYDVITTQYGKPMVISGFEPLDILQSVLMVVKQLAENRCAIENQYQRVVSSEGNHHALDAIHQVFEERECFEWRGIGSIKRSGVRIREEFSAFDAEKKFPMPQVTIADPATCQCGEVLTGSIKPTQCQAFGKTCTPDNPLGALMVSTEGACAAYYNYGWIDRTDIQPLNVPA